MSIIHLVAPALKGALFNEKEGSERQMFVAKGISADVTLSGFIGANDIKTDKQDAGGKDIYRNGAYGRLEVRGAYITSGKGDKAKSRIALELSGGLRGVLFPAKDKDYDYVGNIDAGNGMEYVLFGREVDGDNGRFIGLSSSELKVAEQQEQEPF